MDERGFFTFAGICLMLAAALAITGVREFETNYSSGITIARAEFQLQNLADSYLVENIDSEVTDYVKNLGDYNGLKNCKVEIRAKNEDLQKYTRKYLSSGNKDEPLEDNEHNAVMTGDATIILCVASCDNPLIEGKMYRRALAYIVNADESKTIHFMIDE